ncbi:MAG TPA: hypothetical protein VN200_07060 [Rhodoglobus sp.]|nr:hypothetical protein [Rhodoglobus sp.]
MSDPELTPSEADEVERERQLSPEAQHIDAEGGVHTFGGGSPVTSATTHGDPLADEAGLDEGDGESTARDGHAQDDDMIDPTAGRLDQ